MKNKHTPGLWTVCVHEKETTIESDIQTIAMNVSNCDADLIASAPILLEAVEIALKRFEAIGYENAVIMCRAAIAKARGE